MRLEDYNVDIGCLFASSEQGKKNFNLKDVVSWISQIKRNVPVKVKKIPFSDLKQWKFENGKIFHDSGKFFSIDGLRVNSEIQKQIWDQPIINQPEIGILGILVKKIDGIYHFLLQAKIEPGNINNVQLSPTLQATKSNYTRVHKGIIPPYLEYFSNLKKSRILFDQLQSEQGSRFFRKRNRNMIVEIFDDVEVHENFRWFTLKQIKLLMHHNNLINMDTRSVISCIPMIDNIHNKVNLGWFFSWLADYKSSYNTQTYKIPLYEMDGWIIEPNKIFFREKLYFSVIAASIEVESREVTSWDQPLIEPVSKGLIAVFKRKISNEIYILAQLMSEAGNLDGFELGPTLQYTNGSIDSTDVFYSFLISNKSNKKVIYDTMQSEEGGRFYHEQNRNVIVEIFDDFPFKIPDKYRWISLSELQKLIGINNIINIELRSIISAIYPGD